jgi:hypothetical protein
MTKFVSAVAAPAIALCCGWLLAPALLSAASPESPEVRAMIDKGLKYLESADDARVGGKCLGALCFLKSRSELSHPKVQSALAACRSFDPASDNAIYSLGIAIMFLCELENPEAKSLAGNLLKFLLSQQKPHGGWGYRGVNQGDISQTQYAALALWTAYRAGLDVPQEPVEKMSDFLLRSQDPSGGYGYQASVAPGSELVAQTPVVPSLSAAGLGSALICADLLRIRGPQNKTAPAEGDPEEKLPAAVQVVNAPAKPKPRTGFTSKTIRADVVRRNVSLGDGWMKAKAVIPDARWEFYYIYGLERYYSFHEVYDGKTEAEPEWYNQGVNYLQKAQHPDGSWVDIAQAHEGGFVHTSFALLFLLRSSKTAIRKVHKNLGDGVLVGGMGLPKNVADLRERDGKVVDIPLTGSVDELLAILEDPKNPDLASLADSQQVIKLDADVSKREGQIARLRAMVSAGNFETRLVAVRSLGKTRDMKNGPLLLYALSDPDLRVCMEADKALRFLSRKFEGVGLTFPATRQEVNEAAKAWRQWYLSVQPDAELLD